MNLTLTHLRFDAIAQTPIHLNRHLAGNSLRNGLASVMLRATCPETHRTAKPTPEHAAVCPACWLLAAEVDPGSVVRAYSLVPPLPPLDLVEPGQPFSFVLTLYGDGFHFLPYFVLALAEVGRVGVGPGRGTFALAAICAADPFTGRTETVLQPGENLVRVPGLAVTWDSVRAATARLLPALAGGELTLHFLTPMRLEEGDNRPIKTADFGVFFRRLLYRLDDLGRQFAGQERRPPDEVERLHALADRVRLVDVHTHWLELWSWSGRKQQKTPLGGFVGAATYRTADWEPLLPWLVLGQATQAGKLVIKGNGVYEIAAPPNPGYWRWLNDPHPAIRSL
ncbi:MAG: CRISPR system precrRNA processing endoribonuclease RAMP protein Cas6 [Chloroflexi bacterium]|nr:CRISPR system precrRNA processing endoribonuclease RAMP protein Cas6 [Chloroflexota bacterium]